MSILITSFIAIAFVAASITALAFIIERGLALHWPKVLPPAVEGAIRHYESPADLPRLQTICEQHPSALSRLLLIAIDHVDGSKKENASVLETRARDEW